MNGTWQLNSTFIVVLAGRQFRVRGTRGGRNLHFGEKQRHHSKVQSIA